MMMTYQSLVLKGVVDTAEKEPEGPEVLKAKLEDEVCHQDQCPHQQELHIEKCAASTILYTINFNAHNMSFIHI